ncbi:sugar ABC transporter ATP-binding protein [candidate division KSB1 bacterium]|nr:sugar ABC transporter ATP-binding protein [candidate division KSB1 bacterium]NIV70255.1 ATP-binding cassette domain-containing protein [Phycisphaerae bacterium]NIR71654.1 sugar ABC transporter ATP-binding protein [candidate division KSB1 bacterium]NIT74579.1 sugar ABC transporter ATP-binding protein [candidate division KSB1 bacterium]NIU24077.1 sugar ABC transporter ATP-binding protein [candidate division KSB1 bacterium]
MASQITADKPVDKPRLEMRGIFKRFGATVALKDVNFAVKPGEVHALVGENGAGKTTLMKILTGVSKPDKGKMLLDGLPYQPRNPLDARLKGIGMIYQELSLVPHLTVEENMLLGMEPVRFGFVRWEEMRNRVQEALQHLNHPQLKPHIRIKDLPVSLQQLVEIGRSLVIGCEVLIFDEPTSSLSRHDIDRLFKIIAEFKNKNLSIVYISHFLEEVQLISDRVTVLRDGSVVSTQELRSTQTTEIVRMMVGREIKDLYPRTPRKIGSPVLEIQNLAGLEKPENAIFVLRRGEVMGISGLIGAGRTEMLRAIFGLDPVRQGQIKIGIHLGPSSPAKRWLQGVGMLSENRSEGLAANLNLADNMTLSKLRGFGPLNLVLPRNQGAVVQKWIDLLDIRCLSPAQDVAELSGGNQQKVAIARLLQHGVDIMLLDEPTRGIDVAAKAKIYEVIDAFASGSAGEGRAPGAVLVISSYLPELIGICNTIAVMFRGRLSAVKSVEEIDEHKLMMAATGQETLK